jgi:hypothetical protein
MCWTGRRIRFGDGLTPTTARQCGAQFDVQTVAQVAAVTLQAQVTAPSLQESVALLHHARKIAVFLGIALAESMHFPAFLP